MSHAAEATVEIRNALGLHIKACELIAKAALHFLSKIIVRCGDDIADARSVVSLTALGAESGTRVTVRAEGPDAEAAVKAVAALFESKFGEE